MKLSLPSMILILSLLAALIYNSWPLGYILNPKVAGAGLASDFESVGQPFNWLFVAGDVLSGLLMIAIAVLVFKKNKYLIISLIGLATLGLMTAASALIPLNCKANVSSCGYRQVLGLHNVTGGIGDVGLFIAMLYATVLSQGLSCFKWNKIFLWTWSILGLVFLLSAIPAVNNLKHIITIAVIWQDLFIILSGVLVVLCTYTYLRVKGEPKAQASKRKLAISGSK